jgi:predicted glycoside hydrolase/deacetylase ChbG (UPF0249 family)
MQPGLIINADYLGLNAATTQGVLSAYRRGILSSATLMVTMPTAQEAAQAAVVTGLPVGLHVALTQGSAVAGPRLDRLVSESGAFRLRAGQLIRIGRRQAALIEQIRLEIRAQLARASDLGLPVTHVDSHQHVHMNPTIFALLEDEACRFGIKRIRFSREPLRSLLCARQYAEILRRNNLSKWLITRALAYRITPRLETTELFFGIINSGAVVKRVLLKLLATIPTNKSVEICIHPALPLQTTAEPGGRFDRFSSSAFRLLEYDALVAPEVIALVRKRGLTLRSFDGRQKDGFLDLSA